MAVTQLFCRNTTHIAMKIPKHNTQLLKQLSYFKLPAKQEDRRYHR
ncbi:hypothetical protein PSECIP111951_01642 [Pseudoalteromonas holothuriae]|uniref:Uncharacterized protein n=1 Tax=Pseudoalteromonas holothuriae TaxID=2963714 RepID=A0ABM9GH46_9GAMM|nr:hypothetical protein PSECIP111951_01642 [Pseudoalteromonas sp. CIP111951]